MKIKTLCSLILLLFGASLASSQTLTRCGGPSTALQINWPVFQFDVCHTGYNPYESTLKTSNVRNLALAWQFAGQYNVTSPAIVNGTVYFADNPGGIYAVNASTGTLVWKYTAGWLINFAAVPAISGGTLYVGAEDNNVYALNATTGALQWKFATGSIIDTAATVDGGIVYIGSEDHNLYALDAKTGLQRWKYTMSQGSGTAPAVVNGIAYVVSQDASVYALNARTGALLWKYVTGGNGVFTAPVVFQGVAYVASDAGVYAFNALSGSVLWKNTTVQNLSSSPALANGVLYVGWDDNGTHALSALDAGTGASMWENKVSGEGPPIVANGVIYLESDRVSALRADTGEVLWTYYPGGGGGSPAVVNGVLYAPCNGANICALRLPSQY